MPSTVLAIDPGIDAGWALFVEGRLTDCGMGNLPEPSTLPPVCLVIAERPHIHRGTRNPDDIVTLAIDLGMRLRPYRDAGKIVDTYLPVQWKGNVPKEIHHPRVMRALTVQELATVARVFEAKRTARAWLVPPGKQHNVKDAIGLGLFGVGRGV